MIEALENIGTTNDYYQRYTDTYIPYSSKKISVSINVLLIPKN